MKSFADIFELMSDNLKEKISEVAFNSWIRDVQPLRFDGDVAYLFASTSFHQNILEQKYKKLIEQSFNEVLGFDITVVIETSENMKPVENPVENVENQNNSLSNNQQNNMDLDIVSNIGEYKYTFDSFIVGDSNNFAYAACKSITDSDKADKYNPLFIYGQSGLGKTHLLMAIENEFNIKYPHLKTMMITSESFTLDLISHLQKKSMEAFHNKYRTVDVLLVDDIQFIAGKESTQEEFFHTFNALHQVGKQIVLTSDRPPKEIKTLEDRLKSRFEWGLLADVSPPNFETRMAIIQRKADQLELELSNEICSFIANKLKSNIRQLEGAVKKLKANKLMLNQKPSINEATRIVKEILDNSEPIPVTVENIIEEVAKTYNVSSEDVRSNKRAASISNARKASMYIIREITGMSFSNIGEEFSGRDHSTVLYAVNKVIDDMKKDSHLKEMIEDIIKNIRNR